MSAGVQRRLRSSDYATNAATLARDLLGRVLVRTLDDGTVLSGIIVETEAYLGVKDRAAHTFGGRRTPRNEQMYGKPGTAYVYFTYGMHFCMNIVCGREGEPVAVLIRAVEPIGGLERMRELRGAARRGKSGKMGKVSDLPDRDLCRGPARLCQAMAIGRELNGHDLTAGEAMFVCEPPTDRPPPRPRRVVRTPRIGVAYAGEWAGKPLRFAVRESPFVSGPRLEAE